MADVDGDGDLDAYVTNYSYGGHHTEQGADQDPVRDRLWINDGDGNFVDSGWETEKSHTMDAALADFDGDGDVDLIVVGQERSEVWLNDGKGVFSNSGENDWYRFGSTISIGDLDGDNDIDAVIGTDFVTFYRFSEQQIDTASQVLLFNDGHGQYSPVELSTDASIATSSFALADLNGDGALDIVGTARDHEAATDSRTHIWFGQSLLIPGDSNFDGVFNSLDLVVAFVSGEYEDNVENNSTFQEGDWNGDGEFDSLDFVFAFQAGQYSKASRTEFSLPAVRSVFDGTVWEETLRRRDSMESDTDQEALEQ